MFSFHFQRLYAGIKRNSKFFVEINLSFIAVFIYIYILFFFFNGDIRSLQLFISSSEPKEFKVPHVRKIYSKRLPFKTLTTGQSYGRIGNVLGLSNNLPFVRQPKKLFLRSSETVLCPQSWKKKKKMTAEKCKKELTLSIAQLKEFCLTSSAELSSHSSPLLQLLFLPSSSSNGFTRTLNCYSKKEKLTRQYTDKMRKENFLLKAFVVKTRPALYMHWKLLVQ